MDAVMTFESVKRHKQIKVRTPGELEVAAAYVRKLRLAADAASREVDAEIAEMEARLGALKSERAECRGPAEKELARVVGLIKGWLTSEAGRAAWPEGKRDRVWKGGGYGDGTGVRVTERTSVSGELLEVLVDIAGMTLREKVEALGAYGWQRMAEAAEALAGMTSLDELSDALADVADPVARLQAVLRVKPEADLRAAAALLELDAFDDLPGISKVETVKVLVDGEPA